MPELAEVEYYRKVWNPGLRKQIASIHMNCDKRVFRECDTETLENTLLKGSLTSSEAHGKQMMFKTNPDGWLGIHLGMSGKLQYATASYLPEKHDHLVLLTNEGVLVFNDYRMFGRISFHQGKLPPEAWTNRPLKIDDPAFDFSFFSDILTRYFRSKLKSLLLNQTLFPGIGNWMADEILWRSGIHPEATAQRISAQKRNILYSKLKEVVEDAYRVIADGWQTPPDSWLFNHRWKDGGRCPVTGKPLQRIQVNGRTTCFSPARQPYSKP